MKHYKKQQEPSAKFNAGMRRRDFIKTAAIATLCACSPELTLGQESRARISHLFPIHYPDKEWLRFPAEGFSDLA